MVKLTSNTPAPVNPPCAGRFAKVVPPKARPSTVMMAQSTQVISAPVTVAREVVDDVASTLRRPDAVLYLGGVVGLAVLGIVEWPVAAVAGVGLAIANGVRRARA